MKKFGIYLLLIFGGTFLIVVLNGGSSSHPSSSATEHPSSQGKSHHITNSILGCRSEDLTSKLIRVAKSGDHQAFQNGFSASVTTGECRMFSGAETVYVEDASLFSGLTQVRPLGSFEDYWIPSEYIAPGPGSSSSENPSASKSPSKKIYYGKGENGFETWAQLHFFATQFRRHGSDELWVAVQSDTVSGSKEANEIAKALAAKYPSFIKSGPIRTIVVFAENKRMAEATIPVSN